MSKVSSLPYKPAHTCNLIPVTRRSMITQLGRGLVAIPALQLVGCGSTESSHDTTRDRLAEDEIPNITESGGGASDGGASDGGASDGGASDGGASDGGASERPDPIPTESSRWSGDGTAVMRVDRYPDPFTSGLANDTCDLIGQLTLGPCYAPTAPVRRDVSEGELGVPMRLALRVVELEACTPVVGAEVEIWYCNTEGLYSGYDVNRVDFCTSGDERAEAAYFARGRGITREDGVVYFDGTFPGWYPGRAVHVHFLVRRAQHVGGVQGTEAALISQVFFPEALTAEICEHVKGYTDRGQPDTTFTTDAVLRRVTDPSPYIVGYTPMEDGAVLAWKTVALT